MDGSEVGVLADRSETAVAGSSCEKADFSLQMGRILLRERTIISTILKNHVTKIRTGIVQRGDRGAARARQAGFAMSDLLRTGLSFERSLLEKFDQAIARRGYRNRSEAVRDLIREYLIQEEASENKMIVGTLSMVYEHHRPKLSEKLIEAQHHAQAMVLAATHVHLDHDNCLEVVIMKGKSGDVRKLADHLLSLRGVKHGRLVITGTGKSLH